MRRIVFSVAVLGFLASSGFASTLVPGSPVVLQETLDLHALNGGVDINSYNSLTNGGNDVVNGVVAGGYNLTNVVASGTVVDGPAAGSNWLQDASIAVTHPGGSYNLTDLSSINGDNGGAPDTFANAFPGEAEGGFDPAGASTFEFYESTDEGPVDSITPDNIWSAISLELWGQTTPDMIVNGSFSLGTLMDGVTLCDDTHSHVSGGLDFFDFTLPMDGTVDIATLASTAGAAGVEIDDTEIGLFDSTGAFIIGNDDNATLGDFYSELLAVPLTAGNYTLVTSGFNSNLAGFGGLVPGDDIGTVTAGTAEGDYALKVTFTAIPEPGTALMLFAGLISILGLRRN